MVRQAARPAAESPWTESDGAPPLMPSQAGGSGFPWPRDVRESGARRRSRSRSSDRSIPDAALAGAVLPETSAGRVALARSSLAVPLGSDGDAAAVVQRPELADLFLREEGWTMACDLLAACVAVLRAHFVQIEPDLVPDMSDFYVRAASFLPGVVHVEYGRYRQAGAAVWAHRPPSPNSSGIFVTGSQMSPALMDACGRLWRCGGVVVFGATLPVASPRVLGGHFFADFVRIEFDRTCGQAVYP